MPYHALSGHSAKLLPADRYCQELCAKSLQAPTERSQPEIEMTFNAAYMPFAITYSLRYTYIIKAKKVKNDTCSGCHRHSTVIK